jgi:hypothetical protein
MDLPDVDEDYFNEVWAADLDVLENLADNGDQPEIPRTVDVSFRGSPEALEQLAAAAPAFGFRAKISESADPLLLLEREQTADVFSIKALTKLSLQFEVMFGVELDGWGCVAQTGSI